MPGRFTYAGPPTYLFSLLEGTVDLIKEPGAEYPEIKDRSEAFFRAFTL